MIPFNSRDTYPLSFDGTGLYLLYISRPPCIKNVTTNAAMNIYRLFKIVFKI